MGDPNPPGELWRVRLRLQGKISYYQPSGVEIHEVAEFGAFINNTSRPGGDSPTFERIWPGNYLDLVGRAGPSAYDMWILAAPNPENGQLEFELKTLARELDCTKNRICRRGNDGNSRLLVLMTIPEGGFGRSCTARNTFRITQLDGRTVVFADDRVNSALFTLDQVSRREPEALGPILEPLNGQICVTESWGLGFQIDPSILIDRGVFDSD